MMKKLLLGAAAVAILTSGAFAASIINVGNIDPNTPNTDVRSLAVGADGTLYAAGPSWSTQYNVQNPYMWTAATGIVDLGNPSGAHSGARGISTLEGSSEVAVSALIGGITRWTKVPMGNTAMASWTSETNSNPGYSHASRTNPVNDTVFIAGHRTNLAVALRFSITPAGWPAAALTSFSGLGGNGQVQLKQVSNDGLNLSGEHRPGGSEPRRAVHGNFVGGPNLAGVPGTAGVRSEGFGISSDGNMLSGLVYGDPSLTYEMFIWDRANDPTGASIRKGAPADASLAVAYAVNNAGMGVGMGFTDKFTGGAFQEHGLIYIPGEGFTWLQDLPLAGLGDWPRLGRALTITDVDANGVYHIGGYGWNANNQIQGFIITIPEPATLSFLALGGLALLRRRR